MNEDELRAATVGDLQPLSGPIVLTDYDPQWPRLFERDAARIPTALGERALAIEHVGSTSAPGVAAKPVIDMVLVVADSSDEAAYVPPLEAAGYLLRIRESDCYEHTKRDLAAQEWRYVQSYADAKTAVVDDIMARARALPAQR
jgi:GrpB-like predicted nucleotidyltransferase (UPF0157 family)